MASAIPNNADTARPAQIEAGHPDDAELRDRFQLRTSTSPPSTEHAAAGPRRRPSVAKGASRQLAGGTITVAVGLAVTGLGTLAMTAIAARTLIPVQYASFVTWWAVATLLGTTFGVFEAYLARLVVTEIVADRDPTLVIGVVAGRAWLLAAGLAAIALSLAPWLATLLFHGSLGVALLLPVFLIIAATQSIQRGSATGHRRFIAIAGQLGTDGTLRAGFVGAEVLLGKPSVTTVALATCLSSASSLIVGDHLCPQWRARPQLRGAGVSWRPVIFLLMGAASPLLVNNGTVPWLTATRSVSALTLGAFAGALTISQLPTQFASAAFGPLLAHLSHAVDNRDGRTFARTRRSARSVGALLGLLFVVAFTVAGHWVLSIYLGPRYRLPTHTFALLATASALMFLAVVQQAGLVALDKWRRIGTAWVTSIASFVLVLAIPISTLLRATIAPIAAVTTALLIMSAVRSRSVARLACT